MRRVSVVGTSGVGKSTFAAALAGLLGVSWVEPIRCTTRPTGRRCPRRSSGGVSRPWLPVRRWVIDGNYSTVRDLVWARADTVIWLDLPKHTVMRRIIWRTLRRIAGRVELWNGNRERWRNFFTLDVQESVIAWAWHTHGSRRQRYAASLAEPAASHLRVVRLRSPRAVRRCRTLLWTLATETPAHVPSEPWPLRTSAPLSTDDTFWAEPTGTSSATPVLAGAFTHEIIDPRRREASCSPRTAARSSTSPPAR